VREDLAAALAAARVPYTEIRLERTWESRVSFRGRALHEAWQARGISGSVRCLGPGGGCGAVRFLGPADLPAQVARAAELARAAEGTGILPLAPVPVRDLESASPPPDDPRNVPLGTRRALVERLAQVLHATDRRIMDSRVALADQVAERWLATSEGLVHHSLESAVRLSGRATAAEEGTVEQAVDSVALAGGWAASARHEARFRGLAERAISLLHAAPVRPGDWPVVLDPRAAAALVHALAAWLATPPPEGGQVPPLGTRIGPEFLNLGDDPTAAGLRGSWVLDEEGSPGHNTVLVRNGVLVGRLHTRSSAAQVGAAPTGHARAGGDGIPRAVPVNSYLAAGTGALPDLLAGIGTGLYLADTTTCELRDQRLVFRPGWARMIRRGELAEPVKGSLVSIDALALLGRLERVGGDFRWDESDSWYDLGAAGRFPVSAGAPHLRFVELPVRLAA